MENRPLFNKVANEILLEVKPIKLRKRIIGQILDLIDTEKDVSYQAGLNECKAELGNYIVDQGILLGRIDALETENRELRTNKRRKSHNVNSINCEQLSIFDMEAANEE